MIWKSDSLHGGYSCAYQDKAGNTWNAIVYMRDGGWRYTVVEGTSMTCHSYKEACRQAELEIKRINDICSD